MIRTALITGSSSGIGLELAKIHASRGENLVLVARSADKLAELKSELVRSYGTEVFIIARDLSEYGAAEDVYQETADHNIRIDYLINNAGFGDFGLFAESNWEKQEKMISLNVTALTHLTRLFLPGMIKRGAGRILNVASTAAFQPGPTMSVYFASKAYVLSFSEALNNELKNSGITVTVLCPGSTDTPFHGVVLGDPALVKKRKMDDPVKVAEFGYKAMITGKTVAIYGLKNTLMANAVRFLPRSFIVKMVRKIQEKKNAG